MTVGIAVALVVLVLTFLADMSLRRAIETVEKGMRENRLRNATPAEALAKVERWKTIRQKTLWPCALIAAVGALIFLR